MPSQGKKDSPGYHLATIAKGELGELSKIMEEVEEAMDAQAQQAHVMVLVELSDTVGAIEAYLARHHPSIALEDLRKMATITKRAFDNGRR
jgi:phosphoribosyl-ATP pyrophosphohydrolase